MNDWQLLERYAQGKDQESFAELVRRNVDVVYAAAVRMLGGPGEEADDVAQAVFLLLSQKAGRTRRRGALAGWLFEVTLYCCKKVSRGEGRRKKYEREAAMGRHEAGVSDGASGSKEVRGEDLLATLDEALGRLGDRERQAILVCYLQGKTAEQTGAVLGVSQQAVEKRLQRGIGKLRQVFARKGFMVPAAGVVAVMAAESAKAAPAAVAASAAGAAAGAAGGSAAAVLVAKGAAAMMKVALMKMVGAMTVAAVLVAGVGAAVVIQTAGRGAPAKAVAATEAQRRPVAPAGPVTIRGIVVDDQGKPVAGVAVDTSMAVPKAPGFSFPHTTTGDHGHFTLAVDADAFYSRFLRGRTADGSRQGYADRWDEKQDDFLPDVKMVLKPAREIAFGVKDARGGPVAGAKVAAAFDLVQVEETVSGADGRGVLRVPADAPLRYVYALKPGVGLDYFALWGKNAVHKDPFHLPADVAGPLAFVLNGARTVTIQVRDEQQRPLAGACVIPWYLEKPNKGEALILSYMVHEFLAFTDAQGKATFSVIPADATTRINFWVRLDGYTSGERWMWDPASGKGELTATLLKMVHLAGRVVGGDGKPVAGATVRVGGAGYQLDDFSGELISGADGSFGIDVDPEMYYALETQKGEEVSPLFTRIVHKEPPAALFELKLAPANRVYGTATAGPENKPVAKLHVSLYLRDDSYNRLRPEERFPGPILGRKSIEPAIHQHVTTDAQGRFEFYTSPGNLQTDCSLGYDRDLQNFTLDVEDREVPIHFQSASPAPGLIHGRVVRADKPEAGVAKAVLSSQPVDFNNHGMVSPEGTADTAGHFEIRQALGEMYLKAASPDESLAAIVLVKPGDDDLTIPIAPAAQARGRLVDEAGKPMRKREVTYGIRMQSQGVFGDTLGGRVTTGDDGAFLARGLAPGKDYNFSMQVPDAEGVDHFHSLARVTPDGAKAIDLGDLKVEVAKKPAIRPVARAAEDAEVGEDGDWRVAFERAYALGEKENLRFIAPPAMGLRQKYLRETMRSDSAMPFIVWRWTDGQIKRGWMSSAGPDGVGLEYLLSASCKLDQDHVSLAGVPAINGDGDWIVRDGATTEAILADLQKILREQFKTEVRFEKKEVEKDALVFSGAWRLAGADEAEGETVQIYAGVLDHPKAGQSVAGGGSGKSAEFWSELGGVVGVPVVDEATGAPARIRWAYSWSSQDAAHDAARRDQILENVGKQTGLTFKRETRRFTVWQGSLAGDAAR